MLGLGNALKIHMLPREFSPSSGAYIVLGRVTVHVTITLRRLETYLKHLCTK